MGAQWKQKWRELYANQKGKLVTKLVREIQVAAQQGGADPDLNARLAAALEKARKNSVSRDTIERAVKVGSGQLKGEMKNLEAVTYEGFAPHKVPVIVECLTDNRNRTAPEIKVLFKAGTFGTPGSVSFLFDHLGVVEATHEDKSRDPESDAIEAGAQNVEALDGEEIPEGHLGARFLTDPKDLAAVAQWLTQAGWKPTATELRYIAKSYPDLTEAQAEEVATFLSKFEEHDDVHAVHAAIK